MQRGAWVSDENAALFTDLYELTMLQAYLREGLQETAVFDLFVRRLPENRSYLVACGLEDCLRYLENLAFSGELIDRIRSLGPFEDEFLERLRELRFTGNVYAVREGTPVFPDEPILEVEAPLPEAQVAETFLLNQVTFQTLAASKASRVVRAARGRTIVDFGARRMHGADAALKAARAFHVAGVQATSNVLAGAVYGIPVAGTMAHSYVEAHDAESDAFREFARLYPETVLLVDTYDTLEGVEKVIRLAEELGDAFRVRAVRLDSGDLADLARKARAALDRAGLERVEIFASSSLDEYAIAGLLDEGAPIDGFGVGTRMGASVDSPALDSAYKLVAYAGKGRMKLSSKKATLPGRKQVYRRFREGRAIGDLITTEGESAEGEPLLAPVLRDGRRVHAKEPLDALREHARREIDRLPPELLLLEPPGKPYPVKISERLEKERRTLEEELSRGRS